MMSFARVLSIFALVLVSQMAVAGAKPPAAPTWAEFMASHPALTVNSEYLREAKNGYSLVTLELLRSLTPVMSANDSEFITSLDERFNREGNKKIRSEI